MRCLNSEYNVIELEGINCANYTREIREKCEMQNIIRWIRKRRRAWNDYVSKIEEPFDKYSANMQSHKVKDSRTAKAKRILDIYITRRDDVN